MNLLTFISTKFLLMYDTVEIGGDGEVALELVNIPLAFTTSQLLPSRSTFCGDGPSPGNRLISGGRCDLSSESVSALNLVVDRESARPKLLTHNTWLGCVDGPRLTMNRGRVLIFQLWDVLILEFFSYPVKLDVLIRGLLKHALAGYCLLLVSK